MIPTPVVDAVVMPTAQHQLDTFLDKFAPEIAAHARAVLDRARYFVPGAIELIYDTYHALVVSFGPTTRAADAVLSVAVYPRWVTLFLMHGAAVDDPFRLLHGTGSAVRGVRIKSLEQFDDEHLQMLVEAAVAMAPKPIDETRERLLVIKSVSDKQRPRR
ncbi:hypothetical protein [Gemmatimonas sp.]|uniref:hypothetical protein n=1 Tax=Gemmatimonas sp. TaxID=1962908 RepID=UPI00391FA0D9